MQATGIPQRPEVTAQLFNLLTESQSKWKVKGRSCRTPPSCRTHLPAEPFLLLSVSSCTGRGRCILRLWHQEHAMVVYLTARVRRQLRSPPPPPARAEVMFVCTKMATAALAEPSHACFPDILPGSAPHQAWKSPVSTLQSLGNCFQSLLAWCRERIQHSSGAPRPSE